jgi:hypothetical protein
MTAEILSLTAGTALSLVFSYVPGLNAKFAALDPTVKRLWMLGLLLLSALGVFGLSCAGWVFGGIGVTCDQAGIQKLVEVFFLAAIANQTSYALSPETKKVQAAKLGRG